jgi:hypothetical protein
MLFRPRSQPRCAPAPRAAWNVGLTVATVTNSDRWTVIGDLGVAPVPMMTGSPPRTVNGRSTWPVHESGSSVGLTEETVDGF